MYGERICHHAAWIGHNECKCYTTEMSEPQSPQAWKGASASEEVSAIEMTEIVLGLKVTLDRPRDRTSVKILSFQCAKQSLTMLPSRD